MSTELMTVQQELTIAKQDAEIMKLRFELQKVQAEKTSRLEDSLFAPALFPHYQKVAETLAKSSVIPTIYRNKPEDIFVAMAMGYQLGFPVEQSLQDIAVINGRPCLWGDGLLSLALNHPECQSIQEEPLRNPKGEVVGYQCTVVRKGHEPHSKQFTLQDASVAGLLSRGTVWKAYPERMLQMRARSFALRDKFADALRGLRIAEIENEDSTIIEAEVISVEKSATQTDKLKKILKPRSNNDKSSQEGQTVDVESTNSESSQKAEQGQQCDFVDEDGAPKNPVHNTGKDDEPISDEQIDTICSMLKEKEFSDERTAKALAYYKVSALEDLSDAQARLFILQLERA